MKARVKRTRAESRALKTAIVGMCQASPWMTYREIADRFRVTSSYVRTLGGKAGCVRKNGRPYSNRHNTS